LKLLRKIDELANKEKNPIDQSWSDAWNILFIFELGGSMSVEIADFFVNVIEFKVFDDFLNLYLEDDVLKGS